MKSKSNSYLTDYKATITIEGQYYERIVHFSLKVQYKCKKSYKSVTVLNHLLVTPILMVKQPVVQILEKTVNMGESLEIKLLNLTPSYITSTVEC